MKHLDYETFCDTVDPLWRFDLDEMGIKPCADLGYFSKRRFDELVAYCQKNPSCHIISHYDEIRINAAIPNAGSYMLGAGDKNPDLVWFKKWEKNHTIDLELLKFLLYK